MLVGLVAVTSVPAVADAPAPGEVWTARTAASANMWVDIAYGNGTFVAVSWDGTDRVMTSPDGVTWTARSAATVEFWTSVTYGNGLFVVVSGNGLVMTSPDGVTWTSRTGESMSGVNRVTYGNGLFVAVAAFGANRVMTSPDGVTWTARPGVQSKWLSVTHGNGVFVAVAEAGTDRVMTSPDGVTWTARSAAAASEWYSVTFGNGLFVAVSAAGLVMTSPDGVTWTARSAPSASMWLSVAFGGGLFVAVAGAGTDQVMTSSDGVTWTGRSAADASFWYSVVYGNGQFVAIAMSGTYQVMTSPVPEALVPAAPTSLSATLGVGSASIAFTAGGDGGSAITKYQAKVGSGAWTDVVGTTSPITVTGLTNYATVNIKLRAVNAVGAGAASTWVKVWPRIAGPSSISGVAVGTSKIRASFSALTPAGGTTSHYWVYAYTKGTTTVAGSCRSTAVARGCLVTGLAANTEYDVIVRGFYTLIGSPTVLPTFNSTRQTVRTNT